MIWGAQGRLKMQDPLFKNDYKFHSGVSGALSLHGAIRAVGCVRAQPVSR